MEVLKNREPVGGGKCPPGHSPVGSLLWVSPLEALLIGVHCKRRYIMYKYNTIVGWVVYLQRKGIFLF